MSTWRNTNIGGWPLGSRQRCRGGPGQRCGLKSELAWSVRFSDVQHELIKPVRFSDVQHELTKPVRFSKHTAAHALLDTFVDFPGVTLRLMFSHIHIALGSPTLTASIPPVPTLTSAAHAYLGRYYRRGFLPEFWRRSVTICEI